MDADTKQLWVEALRSGKYKQGKGTLRDIDGTFCCLGVLCDVIAPNDWRRDRFQDGNYAWDHTLGDNELYDPTEQGLSHEQQTELIDMNDGDSNYGKPQQSFAKIADYIEENI